MAFVKRARLPQAEDSAPMRVSRSGNPSLQMHHPITTLSVGYCTGAGGFLRVNKMMNVMLPSLPAYISIMMTMRENVFKSRVMPVVKPTVSMAEKTSISTC